MLCTHSASVLAGNLGRVSMSKQEMVRSPHSEHSHTAGQESASEPGLLMERAASSREHVTACMSVCPRSEERAEWVEVKWSRGGAQQGPGGL